MNSITLFVSGISTACIIAKYNLINCSYFVGIYCIFDLYYVIQQKNISMIIHHLYVIALLYFSFRLINEKNIEIETIVNAILSTEISTNFLIMKNILSKNNIIGCIVHINNLLFVVTFFYYRLYNYGIKVVVSKPLWYIVINNFTNMETIFLYFSLYGLFFLNIYWFVLILKKIYHTLMQPIMPP